MNSGLRKRPTYNELINYIERDIKIKLPNRDATFLRNSPYMTQLDNFVDTDHETKVNNNTIATQQANNNASASGQTASVLRSQVPSNPPPPNAPIAPIAPVSINPIAPVQVGGSSGSFIPSSTTPQNPQIIANTVNANLVTQQDSANQLMDTTGSTKRPPDSTIDSPAKAKAKATPLPIDSRTKAKPETFSINTPKSETTEVEKVKKEKFDNTKMNKMSNRKAKLDPNTDMTIWQGKRVPYIKDQLMLQGVRFTPATNNLTKQEYINMLDFQDIGIQNATSSASASASAPASASASASAPKATGFWTLTDKQKKDAKDFGKTHGKSAAQSVRAMMQSGKSFDEASKAYLAKGKK